MARVAKAIEDELGLTASAGIAPNKFLAKIASDWNKPNGQFTVKPSEVAAFVKKLKIEKIWGVGKVTAKKMHSLGLHTCEDIQKQPVDQLGSQAVTMLFERMASPELPSRQVRLQPELIVRDSGALRR